MKKNPSLPPALTPQQARLVRDNIGLVHLHLQRRVMHHKAEPRRSREYDDLFQEGCLGLISAVLRYRPDRGIPFPAYAIPRIRQAVSAALSRKFATIPPELVRPPGDVQKSPAASSALLSLDDVPPVARPRSRPLHEPDDTLGETIGARLYTRCTRALRAAARKDRRRVHPRPDRARLVRSILKERLLEPCDEARTSQRALARRSESSPARVAQCERKLLASARILLEEDQECRALRAAAHRDPLGLDALADDRQS